MKYIIINIIKLYQVTIGLYMGGSCRFSPTCSEYMKLAILKYGTIKGVRLGFFRLIKCHPYSKQYGIDEV